MKRLLLVSCLTATVFAFTECATNPVTGKKEVVLMSEQQEIQQGQEADPQVKAQFGVYEDQNLQSYVNDMGQRLVKVSHRPNIAYHFTVINSDVVNAFALPGGYVYFTRGIMGYLNDEAQFAGVLGHEIGHITARHAVEQQRNATLGQIGILAGMVISPTIAQFGQALSQGYSLLMLKYSRDDERQADELGVEYSTKIGYDAKEMANFFQTLQRISQSSGQEELPPFLSTHPDPGDRYNTVTKLAAQWKSNTGLTNPAVNRNAYLQKIDGIIYGEDPKEGYLEGNTFYHPVMKFQITRPTGWGYSNSPQQVQFVAPDGKAALILTMAQGNSLQAAAQAFVQQYQMTVTRSGATTVNGLSAYVVEASLQQQQGTIATISYFIQYNNAIYQLLGVAGAQDFPSYGNTIVNSIMTFRELTDPSKLNKQPERIRVKPAPTTGTLQQELLALGVPQARLNELAIVNGMNLTTQVQAGTLIKVLGTGTL